MQISDFGLEMIMAFEGFSAKVYQCPAGVATQGYGHTDAAGGEPLGGSWTKEKAKKILLDDVERLYAPKVLALLKVKPTQGQFDALVSFAYNCGVAALARSSILKFHNRGEHEQAAGAFMLWVKAGGKTLPGLIRRRGTESLAYLGIQDVGYDGIKDDDDPLYGAMPQRVGRSREKIGKSRSVNASVAASAGGIGVVIASAQEGLTQAQGHFSAGDLIGIALGVLVIAGTLYGLYSRWDDAGRPLPKLLRGDD